MKKTNLLLLGTLLASRACALSVGQVDTFQDGTLNNWGGGASPTNVASGGPAGSGDKYLQLTSTGTFGAGSHMATPNASQWSGNYIATGVTKVECDMKNFGSTDLSMRIVVFSVNFSRYTSVSAVTIPANSGWMHVTFSLGASDMMMVAGVETHAQALASASQLMFRHDPVGSANGSTVAAQLGIDNVKAVGATTVSGMVGFGQTTLATGSRQVTFEYRTPGTQTVVQTESATINLADPKFTIPAPATPGSYDLAVKFGHWLRKKATVNTSSGSVTGVNLDLVNGDIDGDNVISVFDYLILSSAFDSTPSDSNWVADADLDEDGTVSVFDYLILSEHFDMEGDN